MFKVIFSLVLTSIYSYNVYAQTPKDASVELTAIIQTNPDKIKLTWTKNSLAISHIVYRKIKTANSWGVPKATLDGTATEYIDSTITKGTPYEYQILRNGNGFKGYGYIFAGMDIPMVEDRGILILVVDSLLTGSLSTEIALLKDDLEGDGWELNTIIVSRQTKVEVVRSLIIEAYNKDKLRTKAVFLLGHIPVPYSGRISPDGHPDHLGAWPADVFYADINGQWTDNVVNSANASDERNNNIPNDGKYDQNILPSDVELQIGRVDFADMDAFSLTEHELMRQYLKKDHEYKHKIFAPIHRAVIDDNFGFFGGEVFAESGWRNAAPLVGLENVTEGDYFTTMKSDSYLWSYGCGGGTYTSAGGIGSTNDFVSADLQSVFTMLFGSYFGDWDSRNNFLRAPLAQGKTLTNVWAGRPHWVFHHMGLGENIGYDVKATQNNNALYFGNYGNRFIHIALMGDPTLRNDILAPVSDLVIKKIDNKAKLTWYASKDAVLGYHIYMKNDSLTNYVRLNDTIWNSTVFIDSCLLYKGKYSYMIKAVNLQTTPSGTFYNTSQGMSQSILNETEFKVNARASFNQQNNTIFFINTSANATSFYWDFNDGFTSTDINPFHVFEKGVFLVRLIASNECDADTLMLSINITTKTEDIAKENVIIYPNPTTGQCILSLTNRKFFELLLINTLGRKVWQSREEKSDISLDLSDLPKGVYYLHYKDQHGNRGSKKLILYE